MAIRIFIDQGHNPSGHNAGAEGNGLREQDVTYNVGTWQACLMTMSGSRPGCPALRRKPFLA
ncbi:MAG: hypothetical protein ACLVJZ_02015 [[Clostridium] leptum]